MRKLLTAAGGAALALISAPAFAQQAEEAADWSVEWEIGVVSDYRFRGYSLSDEDPALQGGLTVSAPNGLYAFAWGSSIAEYGATATSDGARVELDLGIGYATSLAGFDIDISAVRYSYPGGEDVDYWELPVSASRTVGDWTLTLGGAYVPDQSNTGGDNGYVWGGADWAMPTPHPVTLSFVLGHEDGAFADHKTDWSLGASTSVGIMEFGLTWIDADDPGVDGAFVASLKAVF